MKLKIFNSITIIEIAWNLELFISGVFHLMFLDYDWLWVSEAKPLMSGEYWAEWTKERKKKN